MLATSLHREDIKAILRKRHGSVAAFAATRGIKAQGVADFLRGRTSAAVEAVLEDELQAAESESGSRSIDLDNSAPDAAAHRLNTGGR